MNNTPLLDHFKNENLSPKLLLLKRSGVVGAIIAAAGLFIIMQLNGGKVGGTPFQDVVSDATAIGALVAIVSFVIIAMVSTGKTKSNTATQAIGRTLLKTFLYMLLPAIIITFILVAIFILPRYA